MQHIIIKSHANFYGYWIIGVAIKAINVNKIPISMVNDLELPENALLNY